MEAEIWALPLDLSRLDRLHENYPGHLGKRFIFISASLYPGVTSKLIFAISQSGYRFVLFFLNKTSHT